MSIEQIGNAVIFYGFYTLDGLGATGLAVTADMWKVEADGTATEIASAQPATEIGDGLYRYRVVGASIDVRAEYVAVFKTVGVVDQAHIAAIWVVGKTWVENMDVASSTLAAAIAALNDLSLADLAAWVIEAGVTFQTLKRLELAWYAGATAGANTTNPQFMSQDGGTTRIDMTVDTDGDRSAVAIDGS